MENTSPDQHSVDALQDTLELITQETTDKPNTEKEIYAKVFRTKLDRQRQKLSRDLALNTGTSQQIASFANSLKPYLEMTPNEKSEFELNSNKRQLENSFNIKTRTEGATEEIRDFENSLKPYSKMSDVEKRNFEGNLKTNPIEKPDDFRISPTLEAKIDRFVDQPIAIESSKSKAKLKDRLSGLFSRNQSN